MIRMRECLPVQGGEGGREGGVGERGVREGAAAGERAQEHVGQQGRRQLASHHHVPSCS